SPRGQFSRNIGTTGFFAHWGEVLQKGHKRIFYKIEKSTCTPAPHGGSLILHRFYNGLIVDFTFLEYPKNERLNWIIKGEKK
ncbi:MAG: hypothetical protein WC977_07820, partial [Anaerovoracaceae bacterium]